MKRTTKPKKTTKKGDKYRIDTTIYTFQELQDKLLPRQKRFCHKYIEDYNGTRSYMFAYNYVGADKVDMAGVNAAKLLGDNRIKQYIAYIEQNVAQEVGITKIGLLKNLKLIADSDLTDLFSDWITRKEFKIIKEQFPGLTKTLKKVDSKVVHKTDMLTGEPFYEEYLKIELKDSLKATEMIFKAMGWNEAEKVELSFEQPLFPDAK